MQPKSHNKSSTMDKIRVQHRPASTHNTLKRAAADPKWPKPATKKRQCAQSNSPDSQDEQSSAADTEWPSDYPDSIHSSQENSDDEISMKESDKFSLHTGLDGQKDSSDAKSKLFEYLARGEKEYKLQNHMEFWNKIEGYLEHLSSSAGGNKSRDTSNAKSVDSGEMMEHLGHADGAFNGKKTGKKRRTQF